MYIFFGGDMSSSLDVGTSGKTIEIIPAVLVKSRADLINAIELVKPYVKTVQIDIMDGVFVPNKTIGTDELVDLPTGVRYEFHWMVEEPENWIERLGPERMGDLHLVHVESFMDFNKVKQAVEKRNAHLGIAFNPATPLEKLNDYGDKINYVLAMTVVPGFSGQKYISSVEAKIIELRKRHPGYDIEVDGGITVETVPGAVQAGANKIVAASAIYGTNDVARAIQELTRAAQKGNVHG